MPNFDGKGPRGRNRRAGSGSAICRRGSEGRSGQASGSPGSRLSDLLWLVREVLSIWGAVKALRGTYAAPSLSVTERDTFKRVNRPRLQKPTNQINQADTLDMPTPSRLIEYRRMAVDELRSKPSGDVS